MNENMKLWDSVCVTDPAVTKAVSMGQYKYTAICAQSQIKEATKLWGSMGNVWGVWKEEYKVIGEYCIYTAEFYYPDGKFPIHADSEIIYSGGNRKGKYNDDFSKKMATDALTKGLSKLGFNADVFEGKFDDNKYVAQLEAQNKKGDKSRKKQSDPTRQKLVDEIVSIISDKVFNSEDRDKAKKEIEATKVNKSLAESVTSLKALKATYESQQNERIKEVKKFVHESKNELDIF